MSQRYAQLTLGAAVATGTVLALAVPAAAHVTIDPSQAPGGGYTTVNVKVPNERDDASTVSVELHLDLEHPLSSVRPQAVPGWDVDIETTVLDEPVDSHGTEITEVTSKITWSGGEIGPGMFQQFPLALGRLPEDTDQLVFKAVQTYDSGEEVRWIDVAEDAENPAAVLALTAAEDGHGSAGDSDDAEDADAGDAGDDQAAAEDGENGAAADSGTGSAEAAGSDGADTTARVLAAAGIALGALGVAFGLLAGRRRTTDS
jgi:uncharacterized protein YcnI